MPSYEKETDMPRVHMTKTVRFALYLLRFYLAFLVILLAVRFIKALH